MSIAKGILAGIAAAVMRRKIGELKLEIMKNEYDSDIAVLAANNKYCMKPALRI